MKSIGRILMILSVFALAAGLLYAAVTATSTSSATTSATQFERPRPDGDERPEIEGGASGEWIFETAKNLIVIAIVVALVNTARAPYQRKRVFEALRLH